MKKFHQIHFSRIIFTIFVLFQSARVFNPFNVITWAFLVFCSFVAIFIVCELGERMSNMFKSFNETLYQSNWYEFPIEIRRMFALVLMDAQQTVMIEGFANTLCARKSFKKVILHRLRFHKAITNFNYNFRHIFP